MNNTIFSFFKLCLLQIIFILGTACSTTQVSDDNSLYAELGGKAGVDAIIEKFLWNVSDDDRIFQRFADSDIARFQEKMGEFICQIANGPCQYSGDDMKRVHAGHDISEMQFNAVVENLLDAMEEMKYSVSTQNKLISRLAPMHGDIVRQ